MQKADTAVTSADPFAPPELFGQLSRAGLSRTIPDLHRFC